MDWERNPSSPDRDGGGHEGRERRGQVPRKEVTTKKKKKKGDRSIKISLRTLKNGASCKGGCYPEQRYAPSARALMGEEKKHCFKQTPAQKRDKRKGERKTIHRNGVKA